MIVSRNNNERTINNKWGSLIINNKKRKIIIRNTTNDTVRHIEPNIDNNIHLFCNTSGNQPIETFLGSNINMNMKKQNKLIYYKNKLKKSLLLKNNLSNNTKKQHSLNAIDFKDQISPVNKELFKSKINKYIASQNTLRKNMTGLQLKKDFLDKVSFDYGKFKNNNKSLKNLSNNIFSYFDKDKKLKKTINFMKNHKNNKLNKIKEAINTKNEYIPNIEEEIINNKNDDKMSKELFNLLVKRLNKSIEDNEKDQKIIRKLREENNKLKQKIFLDSKKNEMTLRKQAKELFEIKKNRDFLKKENQKLKEDMLKLILTIKENKKSNNNNLKFKEDNIQLNQLDSICSLIGSLSALSSNSTEKE